MAWMGASRSPIGIDVSGRFMNAVQLTRHGRGWRIDAASSVPRSDAAMPLTVEELSRLASMLYRQGFRGGGIVMAVPTERLVTGMLELADGGVPETRRRLARAELAGVHKCPPGELEIACWQLPKPARRAGSSPVIAVGCKQDDATGLIDLFEAVGMDVLALDVASWAAARATGAAAPDSAELVPLLNLGWAATELVVAAEGVVVFERILPEHGMNRLHSRLTAKLDLETDVTDHILHEIGLETDGSGRDTSSDLLRSVCGYVDDHLDRLTSEIDASLSYAAQEYPHRALGRVLVHGEGAMIAGIDRHLSARLDQDAAVVLPRDLVSPGTSPSVHVGSPHLVTALGLAMYRER